MANFKRFYFGVFSALMGLSFVSGAHAAGPFNTEATKIQLYAGGTESTGHLIRALNTAMDASCLGRLAYIELKEKELYAFALAAAQGTGQYVRFTYVTAQPASNLPGMTSTTCRVVGMFFPAS